MRRARLGLVLLVLLSVTAPLAICEVALRLTDPARGAPPDGRVDGVLYSWGHRVTNNRFDFREREFAVPKPEGVFRIMVLGDSFTWGVGLALEERYTNRLESILAKAIPERRFEVLNFGRPAIATLAEAKILLELQDFVVPDLIAVGFCLNDPQVEDMDHSPERASLKRALAPVRASFDSVGLRETGQRVQGAAWRLADGVDAVPTWEEALDRSYDERSRDWRGFLFALRLIRDISHRRGLPPPLFAVLDQGSVRGAPLDYRDPDPELRLYLRWYHQAAAAARAIGYLAYDHGAEIARELSARNLWVNPWDAHPSAELHRIYAEKMATVIFHEVLKGRR